MPQFLIRLPHFKLQYEGNYTAEVVKKKIIELMFMWSKGLPNEIKVAEAYKMLKQQGLALS